VPFLWSFTEQRLHFQITDRIYVKAIDEFGDDLSTKWKHLDPAFNNVPFFTLAKSTSVQDITLKLKPECFSKFPTTTLTDCGIVPGFGSSLPIKIY
jgi:hypothetical protein